MGVGSAVMCMRTIPVKGVVSSCVRVGRLIDCHAKRSRIRLQVLNDTLRDRDEKETHGFQTFALRLRQGQVAIENWPLSQECCLHCHGHCGRVEVQGQRVGLRVVV